MDAPLETSSPPAVGLAPEPLERFYELITRHIAEGRYPGAQIAVARAGHRVAALLERLPLQVKHSAATRPGLRRRNG